MRARNLAALVALGLLSTGCGLAPEITTSAPYDAADGAGVSVESIQAKNLLLVGTAEGEPAVLIGTVFNTGAADALVTFTVGDTEQSVRIAAGEYAILGPGDGDVDVIVDAPAGPGRLADVSLETSGSSASLQIPIVDATFPEYALVLEELAELDA